MSLSLKKNSSAVSSKSSNKVVGSKTTKKAKKAIVTEPEGPKKWVIVQLTPAGEREKNLSSIIKAVRHILNDRTIEVCIPAVSQRVRKDLLTTFYWDGYIFVKFVEGRKYLKLNDTTYFHSVLCKPGHSRLFSCLDDKDLEPMKRGLEKIKLNVFEEGDMVVIVKGQYKNLPGRIVMIYEGNENVQVYVSLYSKQVLIDISASYLMKVEPKKAESV